MSLYSDSGVTPDDLARRLNLMPEDDYEGMETALQAACSDIEPHVQYPIPIVPAGLKMAILDIAATRYDRTSLSVKVKVGNLEDEYTDEYNQMMQRIASYRKWNGV